MAGPIHPIQDTDARFSIDPITRAIKNETLKKLYLVINDKNSEVFTFELPRYGVEGHDMASCNKVEVHFVNTHSTTKEKSAAPYRVTDYAVDPDDPEKMIFSWTITEKATKFPGSLAFAVHFACLDEETEETHFWWSTATNTTITVLDCVDLTPDDGEEPADLQEKTVTPTTEVQIVRPDGDFRGLSRAIINPIPAEFVIPNGTLLVEENGDYSVREYDRIAVRVSASEPPAEGGGGECDKPHVIEVAELPTEDIDENAVYKCGDSFYQTTKSFEDVIIVGETGEGVPFKDLALLQGITFSFNTIPTKTTDGIMVSDLMSANFHIYYIEDEDNVFMFISNEWESLESFLDGHMFGPYNGIIHDASEATVAGHYLLLFDGLGEYLMPSEDLIIESFEHAKIDVTKVKNLYINIPDVSASVVGAWRFNESLDITANVSGEYLNINFTSGRGYSYSGFDFSIYPDGSYGGATLVYKYSDTSGTVVYYHDDGWSIGYRVIDFGTEPQNIPAVIKEWLVANATPIYEIKAVGSVIFAIGGTTYFADEGMTWGEWLESDYHPDADTYPPFLENGVGPTLWDPAYGRMSYNGKDVTKDDEIIAAATYTYYMP